MVAAGVWSTGATGSVTIWKSTVTSPTFTRPFEPFISATFAGTSARDCSGPPSDTRPSSEPSFTSCAPSFVTLKSETDFGTSPIGTQKVFFGSAPTVMVDFFPASSVRSSMMRPP